MPSGGIDPSHTPRSIQREPSDEYEDYDDQYLDTFPAQEDVLQHKPEIEDDLPDTTMLDSVVLPAIASVRASCIECLYDY